MDFECFRLGREHQSEVLFEGASLAVAAIQDFFLIEAVAVYREEGGSSVFTRVGGTCGMETVQAKSTVSFIGVQNLDVSRSAGLPCYVEICRLAWKNISEVDSF